MIAGRSGAAPRAAAHAGARRMPFAVLVSTLILGGLTLLLVLNTASAANEVQRHDLALRDASIAAQLEELRNEVAASAAPGNLAQAAAALGMVPAGSPAFLVVEPDGSIRVLGHPAEATPQYVPPPPHAVVPAPKPSKTAKPTPSKSARPGARTAAPTRSAARSTRPAAPTPTPTPTVTLPGGNR